MLNKQKIHAIEKKTRQIIGNYFGDIAKITPPINIAKILQENKLSLEETSFNDPTILGTYDKKKKLITVNAKNSKIEQFFTVAHELGHLYLKPKKQVDIFYRHELNVFTDEDTDEQEANWFAAALLMPKELVKKYWNQEKNEKIVAAIFGVSTAAAHWRLKDLKLLKTP